MAIIKLPWHNTVGDSLIIRKHRHICPEKLSHPAIIFSNYGQRCETAMYEQGLLAGIRNRLPWKEIGVTRTNGEQLAILSFFAKLKFFSRRLILLFFSLPSVWSHGVLAWTQTNFEVDFTLLNNLHKIKNALKSIPSIGTYL